MSKSLWFAMAATAMLSTAAMGQSAQFSPQRMSQIVQTLSSDAFEGRGPATRGETKTVDYIVSQGIDSSRLSAHGYGESKPIDTNDNDAGRANNRRVEFTILKK